ncbi:MAG: ABC transporter ATP-binding protein [Bacteroidetes bacterium]|nr:ABC transporter ATP-binding protein [Bacteroidota bacterium]
MKDLLTLNRYFYKYRGRVILGILFVLTANYFGLLPAQLTRKALDFVTQHQHPDISDSMQTITFYALAILGVVLVRGVLMFFMRQTIIVMSRHIEYDMKNEIYDQYQKLGARFYANANTGDLMNRISEDVSRVRMYTGPAIMYTVNIVVMFILVFVAMIRIHGGLTLVVLLPLPILVMMIYYVENIINRQSEKVQESLSELSTTTQETFSGIRIIKSFAKEVLFGHLFEKKVRQYFNHSMKLARVNALFMPAIVLLAGISSIAVIYYGGILVNQHQITYGNIAEFVIYLNMLMWPVGMLGWIITMVQRSDASQRRINEFLKLQPEIVADNTGVVINQPDIIQFENVDFAFDKADNNVLQQINLTLQKGKIAAIVGSTGSGKTTLANLLVRLYDVTGGSIIINGTPIQQLNLNEWRRSTGYITQDVLLFSDTIANNISFGKEDSTVEEIETAAKKAMVYNEIKHFKKGFETILGERGISLSGGQKQRVAIARAIIKKPQLLILDDCLSALDTHTEEHIMQNLLPQLSESITLIIGHRISSVKYASEIYVLDDGKIIERGTHESLMAAGGYYARLAENQAKQH